MSSSSRNKSTRGVAFALAVFSSALTPISLFVLFDWFDSRRTLNDPNAIASLVILSINLLLIGLTLYLHRIEKTREMLRLRDDGLQPVDLTIERKRLTSKFLNEIKELPRLIGWFVLFGAVYLLMGYSINSKVPDVEPVIAMFALVLVLNVVLQICHAFDCYIMAIHRNRAFEEQRKIHETPTSITHR